MTDSEERWHTLAETAAYAKAGESTVRYAAQAGELRGYQRVKGGHWRFLFSDVDRWLVGLPPLAAALSA